MRKGKQLEQFPNLVAMFLDRVEQRGDGPFLWAKKDGSWHATSYNEAARQVAALSASLISLGCKPGHRVMLVAENRPEWLIADLAIMAAGCVTVPTYTTNTTRDHTHILTNSGARAVIVSSQKLAKALIPAVLFSSDCHDVIGIEDIRTGQPVNGAKFHHWAELVAGPADLGAVRDRIAGIGRGDLACLIYTSGTGGAPRGVRQHHGAILHNVAACTEVIANDFSWGDEVFLSFLPASHAYEHSGGQMFPIGLGAQIYFAESLEKLATNIEEVRPTLMIVVPRLFEMLRQRMLKAIEKQGGLGEKLLGKALSIGKQRYDTGSIPLADWPADIAVRLLLKKKVANKFGGRIKAMISGGAPLNPEVGLFFHSLGLTLLQGYGQTEAGPVISCNRPKAGNRIESVGPPLLATEVRFAEDGELLVRGENVMHGYWNNDEETARVLKDGWLLTGDVGHFDDAGRICITDRKKDLIVNDKGDNVSPQRVEWMLTLQAEIAQAMIFGDRRPHLVALLLPEPDLVAECGGDEAALKARLQKAVDRVNAELSVIEKIRRFTLADEAFSVENEQMTPSMKIRRHVLKQVYGERLDGLYGR